MDFIMSMCNACFSLVVQVTRLSKSCRITNLSLSMRVAIILQSLMSAVPSKCYSRAIQVKQDEVLFALKIWDMTCLISSYECC